MDASIKKLMNIPVGWKQFVSQDGAGEKTYNASVTLYCYKHGGERILRNNEGEEQVSRQTLYFNGTDTRVRSLSTQDLITTSDNIDHYILDARPYYDNRGNLDIMEVLI